VIQVTEPQVWVLIGVFAAAMFGVIGIVTSNFSRLIRSEIGGLRAEMSARFDAVDARFNAVDARFNTVDDKFASIERRLDHLDRDVSTLTRRELDRDAD
jgi:hypothetical protein